MKAEPAVNLKCITISAGLLWAYWWLPSKNKFVAITIAYFAYLYIAWYDWLYSCAHNFGPTYLANFYRWGKPKASRQMREYDAWPQKLKDKIFQIDFYVLLGLVALIPFFLHWKPKKDDGSDSNQGDNKKAAVFAIVATLGILYLKSRD
jgi:hypothetical protein